MIIEKINKLVITSELQSKIEYLCNKINDVEWSGLLVYKLIYNEDKSISHFEAFDIIPMNKGSKTYTSFNISEPKRDSSGYEDAMIDYFMLHSEAITDNWKIGLIHSHNTMSAFFSGTDIDEINTNCKGHDFYLSLIVNNEYQYVAKTAYKISKYYSGYEKSYYNNEFGIPTFERSEAFDESVLREAQILHVDMNIDVQKSTDEVKDSIFIDSVNNIIEKAEIKRYNFSNKDFKTNNKVSYSHTVIDYDDVYDWSTPNVDEIDFTEFSNIDTDNLKNKLFRFGVLSKQERLFLAYLTEQYKKRFQEFDIEDTELDKLINAIYELEDAIIQPPYVIDYYEIDEILTNIDNIFKKHSFETSELFKVADMFMEDISIELNNNIIQLNYLINHIKLLELFDLHSNSIIQIINYQFRNEYINNVGE